MSNEDNDDDDDGFLLQADQEFKFLTFHHVLDVHRTEVSRLLLLMFARLRFVVLKDGSDKARSFIEKTKIKKKKPLMVYQRNTSKD